MDYLRIEIAEAPGRALQSWKSRDQGKGLISLDLSTVGCWDAQKSLQSPAIHAKSPDESKHCELLGGFKDRLTECGANGFRVRAHGGPALGCWGPGYSAYGCRSGPHCRIMGRDLKKHRNQHCRLRAETALLVWSSATVGATSTFQWTLLEPLELQS